MTPFRIAVAAVFAIIVLTGATAFWASSRQLDETAAIHGFTEMKLSGLKISPAYCGRGMISRDFTGRNGKGQPARGFVCQSVQDAVLIDCRAMKNCRQAVANLLVERTRK